MLDGFLLALSTMASWQVAVGIAAGILVGYFVGAMPGLTSSIGMALLIPFTFGLDPVVSITMLVSLYMATEYSGAIPAILVNTPGVPAAAITALDGYPMRVRGEAGAALTLSILSAAVGSIASVILLIVSSTAMARFALAFGPVEYFALALMGLSLVTSLAGDSLLKGLVALFFGLVLTVIGTDPIDGVTRFAITPSLLSGVNFLSALIGLFALSEVFFMVEASSEPATPLHDMPGVSAQVGMLRPHGGVLARSSLIGYVVGVIPGAGATIAAIVSYAVQKRISRSPETFGSGNPEGVVASEAAANASVPGALAPLLALGIPGSASAAVLIGALTLHGVQPGPLIFQKHPEIPFSIFVTLIVGMPIMVVLGLGGARLWVKVTQIPKPVVAALVGATCLLGTYASTRDISAVWTAVFFGVTGYLLRKADIHPAPVVLALVLGYLLESNFRRALITSGGDPLVFASSPIGLVCFAIAAAVFVLPFVRRRAAA